MRKRRRLANKLMIMLCAVLIAGSTFFYASMGVSAAESEEWKYGSFKMSLTGVDQRITLYGGSSTFTDVTASLCTDEVSWAFSDLHFIEGNDYVIDSSSIEIVPLVTDITAGGLNRGTVDSVSIKNESNKFNLEYSAQNNKSFIYSNPESFVSISGTNCYLKASGTSTYKGNYFYELLASYDYYVEWQVNFKYQGEMDNENQQPDSNIDMESNIKGGVVLDCGYSIPVKVFQSNEFPIGSEIRFYDEGFISMPSHINTDDEGNISELAYFEIDYVYFLDLVEGHEYRIDSITPSFINFTSSYRNFDCGNFKNLELLMFSTWKDSDTFIYSESDFNTDNAKYLDAPFSFEYDYKFYGFGGDALGINTLSGDFILDCGFKVNVELTDMTKLRLWEENHPEEEYPEGELVTPNPDGSISENPSGGGSGTNLSPITDKIDSSTQKITDKIDTAATVITGEIQASSKELKQELQSQTNTIVNGYDSSAGQQANSDLSLGLTDYQNTEDSLFESASTGMKEFTFFDFESVPAMLTAVTFITSIMGSWFEQAGGASGVGIVLSILFSVMLVSMVLGLYRLYQSAGHRAEARERHKERMEQWKKGR